MSLASPDEADSGENRRVKTQEERIGCPPPGTDPVRHLDVDLVLLEQESRGRRVLRSEFYLYGIRPQVGPDIASRRRRARTEVASINVPRQHVPPCQACRAMQTLPPARAARVA